tara:strand:- start:1294 stop:2181 length:888 start_codon:yes stop_codon:yes gene_type:complete
MAVRNGEVGSRDNSSSLKTGLWLRGRSVLFFCLAFIVVAVYAGSVWYAYDLGLRRGTAQLIPFIKADASPTKLAPEDPGGLKVPHQDKLVYGVLDSSVEEDGVESLMPPPEEPISLSDPTSTRIDEKDELPAGSVDVGISSRLDQLSEPPVARLDDDISVKSSSGNQDQHMPDSSDQETPEMISDNREQPAEHKTLETIDESIVEGNQGLRASYRVQIASLRSKIKAERALNLAVAANSDLLSGLVHRVESIDLGENRGVYYRLQIGSFVEQSAADELCKRLKARSQACFVVSAE